MNTLTRAKEQLNEFIERHNEFIGNYRAVLLHIEDFNELSFTFDFNGNRYEFLQLVRRRSGDAYYKSYCSINNTRKDIRLAKKVLKQISKYIVVLQAEKQKIQEACSGTTTSNSIIKL